MKVKIFIETVSYGEISSFTQEGDLAATDKGFKLAYKIDGDDCRLVCINGALYQRRKGDMTYSVKFVHGANCNFVFSEGAHSFCRTVYVSRATSSLNGSGCEAHITYADDEHSEENNRTDIFVRAEYIR